MADIQKTGTAAIPAPLFPDAGYQGRPGLSVITPMYNEAGGAVQLVEEIRQMLAGLGEGNTEMIVIDDGSTDETIAFLKALRDSWSAETDPPLRILAHGQNAGQSRAIRTGVLAARFQTIAMIDGDGQNDPKDIPPLVRTLADSGQDVAMVAGERRKRLDSNAKRFGSRFANKIRQGLLKDGAADSGCGLKIFKREAFLRLAYFDHLHRYLPFMMQREGYQVVFMPVNHRPRVHGASKYTNIGRLLVAFRDLAGVMWLKARARSPNEISEI